MSRDGDRRVRGWSLSHDLEPVKATSKNVQLLCAFYHMFP
jgi:hypothetical protein